MRNLFLIITLLFSVSTAYATDISVPSDIGKICYKQSDCKVACVANESENPTQPVGKCGAVKYGVCINYLNQKGKAVEVCAKTDEEIKQELLNSCKIYYKRDSNEIYQIAGENRPACECSIKYIEMSKQGFVSGMMMTSRPKLSQIINADLINQCSQINDEFTSNIASGKIFGNKVDNKEVSAVITLGEVPKYELLVAFRDNDKVIQKPNYNWYVFPDGVKHNLKGEPEENIISLLSLKTIVSTFRQFENHEAEEKEYQNKLKQNK